MDSRSNIFNKVPFLGNYLITLLFFFKLKQESYCFGIQLRVLERKNEMCKVCGDS